MPAVSAIGGKKDIARKVYGNSGEIESTCYDTSSAKGTLCQLQMLSFSQKCIGNCF